MMFTKPQSTAWISNLYKQKSMYGNMGICMVMVTKGVWYWQRYHGVELVWVYWYGPIKQSFCFNIAVVELERALTGSILTCSIRHSLDGSVHSQNTVKEGELFSMSLRAEYLHKSFEIHFHMKFFTLHLLIHLFMSLVAYGYLLYTTGYKLIAVWLSCSLCYSFGH